MAAASDVAEIIYGLMALRDGMVPATHNFSRLETGYAPLAISDRSQPLSDPRFISMSIGIGGQISSLLIEAG